MSSSTDKLSGNAKQLGGKLTNNKELEAKGKLEELRGKAKELVSDVKDKLDEKLDDKK